MNFDLLRFDAEVVRPAFAARTASLTRALAVDAQLPTETAERIASRAGRSVASSMEVDRQHRAAVKAALEAGPDTLAMAKAAYRALYGRGLYGGEIVDWQAFAEELGLRAERSKLLAALAGDR